MELGIEESVRLTTVRDPKHVPPGVNMKNPTFVCLICNEVRSYTKKGTIFDHFKSGKFALKRNDRIAVAQERQRRLDVSKLLTSMNAKLDSIIQANAAMTPQEKRAKQ